MFCDYGDKGGNTGFKKPGTRDRDNFILFSELDSYDVEASELHEKLDTLVNFVTPITDVSDDLRWRIEEAIGSSENVVRFPSTRE